MKTSLAILALSASLLAATSSEAATQISATARQRQYLANGTFVGNPNMSGAITLAQLTSVSGYVAGDFPTVNFTLANLTSFYFNSSSDYAFSFVNGNYGYTQRATSASISFETIIPGFPNPIPTSESIMPGNFGVSVTDIATPAIPEPATWAMMILGFAMVGAATRYRRRATRIVYT